MDQKSDIKNRRKERIRSLLEELPEVSAVSGVSEVPELEIAEAPLYLLCRIRVRALRNGEQDLKMRINPL